LDSLGYTPEALISRFETQEVDFYFFRLQNEHRPYKPKYFPLESVIKDLAFEVEYSYDTATILVDTMFLIILALVDILDELFGAMLLSPDLRYEVKNYETYAADCHFLRANSIRTIPQLENSIAVVQTQITALEADRQKISNQIRRAKTPENIAQLKTRRKEISAQITPLRKKLRQAEKILDKSPHLYELLQTEHRLEKTAMNKNRERSYER
jgi:hypothetical protein